MLQRLAVCVWSYDESRRLGHHNRLAAIQRVGGTAVGRAADIRQSDKLLIYHWRDSSISGSGAIPFRAFMALGVESRWPGWMGPFSPPSVPRR